MNGEPYFMALEEQLRLRRVLAQTVADGRFTAPHSFARRPTQGLLNGLDVGSQVEVFAEPLTRGEPVYWAAPLCELLEQTAPTIPDWTVDVGRLLGPAGFVWFARPLVMPAIEGYGPVPLRALGWIAVQQYHDPALQGKPSRFTDATDHLGAAVAQGVVLSCWAAWDGRTQPIAATSLYDGERLSALLQHAPADGEGMGAWMHMCARYVATAVTFLDQRILVAPRTTAPRACRRRLAREGWQHEPLIRVVRLRRRTTLAHDRGTEPVEWSCRWLVRGHWRQQWYPSLNTHQPRWVLPYVKGPEGRPLKPPSTRIFAVVR